MACGAILSKNTRGRASYIFYTLTLVACISATFIFLIALITLIYNNFGGYTLTQFGWTESVFYSILFAGICAVIFFVCGIGARLAPQNPDNDSTLSLRQILLIIMSISGIAFFADCLWLFSEDVFDSLVLMIILIFEVVSLFFWVYDPIIYAVATLFPRKTKAPLEATPGKTNRFAVVICAHNAEQVIGYLLESILATNYPYGKYDTYVVCNNCTDDTALIAQRHRAIPLVRESESTAGKNEALRWMFGVLKEKQHAGTIYDAYIVLSADNLVNENFFLEINTHLNQGHELMQAYLGSKNPNDTIISRCSSIGFWLRNADRQQARARINLSAKADNTGLVIRPSLLDEITWEDNCLTEELSFGVKYLLEKNHACHWIHSAILYDERSLTLKASLRQRTRWMQGRMSTMTTFTPSLLLNAFKKRSLDHFDMALYLIKPFFVLLSFFFYAARSILYILFPQSVAGFTLLIDFPIALVLLSSYFLLAIYTLARENYLRYTPWLPIQFLYTFTWFLPLLRSFMKRNESYWVSSFHVRGVAINEVHEDVQINEARRKLAGLENLHRLPIGQILFKAGIITLDELKHAVAIQRKKGGYLGNILVDNNAITEETLSSYISVQHSLRETAEYIPYRFQRVQIGKILLDAHIINRNQLDIAVKRQQEQGGKIGENMIELGYLSIETLNLFLNLQDVISKNYLDEVSATDLLENMTSLKEFDYESLEKLILTSGLVSNQQLALAQDHQEETSVDLLDALLDLGFITRDTLTTIERTIQLSAETEGQQ